MTSPQAAVSERRRREVLDALRRGTVPANGLDLLAVGLGRFEASVTDELQTVAAGGSVFKAVRGEYGAGKTFFSRWLVEQAHQAGFASAEVQISETETPLHRLETVYRRITENLRTAQFPPSALRDVVDGWLFTLESDVIAAGVDASDELGSNARSPRCWRSAWPAVARTTPAFATALRGYRQAVSPGTSPRPRGCSRGWADSPTSRRPCAGRQACAATSTTSEPSAFCRACWSCCATPGSPVWWSSSTRWRPCSGCAATCETRR